METKVQTTAVKAEIYTHAANLAKTAGELDALIMRVIEVESENGTTAYNLTQLRAEIAEVADRVAFWGSKLND